MLFFLAAVFCFQTRAEVLRSENFSYPDGPLVSVSDGLWGTHSGTTGQVEVISGRAELRSSNSEDVSVLLPGQPYPANSPVVLYVGFTVNFSALPTAGGNYFAHLKNAGNSFRAKVFALTSGATPGQYRIGLANSANQADVTNSVSLALNTDQRIYLRYEVATGTTKLWVNPDYETSPAIVANDATSSQIITAFALRQDSAIGVLAVDDLRIGTTFADVYTGPNTIPPVITQHPLSTSTVEGGTAVFVAAASGTAPLSYQWHHNGIPVSDATNATLTLTTVTTNDAGTYTLTVSNAAAVVTSDAATLTVLVPNASGTLSVVHYNVKGNFASDWTTNAPQVQAIARKLLYLNPDIITLNEIPNGLRSEMTNWMTAFFPEHQLAVSPGTDGVLRSGVISRFPIVRTQSWLLNSSLTNFGYDGTFLRDLFETEIAVPGASEPVHVFVTHLKSGSDATSQQQRAAQCSAISNFLVTVFLPTNSGRPYLLTGDLNEDAAIPMNQNLAPIQRLTGEATGLKLVTPLNPFTLSRFTHSIQGTMDARFDYVIPGGLLFSNIVAAQVFRTDLLPPPLSLNLNSNDSIVASDHLPVQMVFNYPDPPLRTAIKVSDGTVTLNWPTLAGRDYAIWMSTNLATWTTAAASVSTTSNQMSWTGSATDAPKFYRVERLR